MNDFISAKEESEKSDTQSRLSTLMESSDILEDILKNAIISAAPDKDGSADVKTIKELASALKEAVSIKKNLLTLPNDIDSEKDNEIILSIEGESDDFSN